VSWRSRELLENGECRALGFEGPNGEFDVSVVKTKASHISYVIS
jgi:hypothetical protein